MDVPAALLSWQSLVILLLALLVVQLLRLLHKCRGAAECHNDDGDLAPSLRLNRHRSVIPCVGDIMSRQLVTLSPDDTAKTAWRRLQEHHIKTLPVVADNQVVGMIALVDLLKFLGLAWHTLPDDLNDRANLVMSQDVATLMSKPAHTVPVDLAIIELAPLLSDTGLRHLPVVNTEGHLVGIVTQSDIIAGLAHLLDT